LKFPNEKVGRDVDCPWSPKVDQIYLKDDNKTEELEKHENCGIYI
jgi:hypothetical protein